MQSVEYAISKAAPPYSRNFSQQEETERLQSLLTEMLDQNNEYESDTFDITTTIISAITITYDMLTVQL